jgi:uncharacterized protein with von Willebrand factor type A (vWA) domain
MKTKATKTTKANEALAAVIRDNMSPQAVALIAAHLQTINGDSDAACEARWFSDQLIAIVGGPDALNNLFEEVGV